MSTIVQVPIADRTPWELVISLVDQGWIWKPLPSKKDERLALPWFEAASVSPKVFYSGLEQRPEYLRALLQPELLLDKGVQLVPHGFQCAFTHWVALARRLRIACSFSHAV